MSGRQWQIVRLLSSYWYINPSASDTAEGAQRWWLPPHLGVTLEQVIDALDWLVDRGLIDANVTTDGRFRYRRSPDAPPEAFARLAAGPPDDAQSGQG